MADKSAGVAERAGHTKGPWVVGPFGDIWPESDIVLVDGKWAELVPEPRIVGSASGTFVEKGEQEANARLIAAAPELLAALKMAVEQLERLGGDGLASGATIAIAKAEGRS